MCPGKGSPDEPSLKFPYFRGLRMDFLTKLQRSERMSRIRSKGTKPEITLAAAMRSTGHKFDEQATDIEGTPDLVHRRRKIAIFIHGCFWHGHSCRGEKVIRTNSEYWSTKIATNKRRDNKIVRRLRNVGWKVLIVWECRIRGRSTLSREIVRISREWRKSRSR